MSDFDIREASAEDSAPVELYFFEGTYKNYYFTSDSVPITHLGFTYKPLAGLMREGFKVGTHNDDDQGIIVSIPISNQIVVEYGFENTPPKLDLTIFRRQRGLTTSYGEVWKGSISSISITNEIAKFKSLSKFAKMLGSNVPNVYFQGPCNNVLYDERCKVSRAANTLNTQIATIVNSRTFTIPSLGAFADGHFLGGEIAIPAKNERRLIIAQAGTQLTVNYEFSGIEIGTSIEVTGGCDHSYDGAGGCLKFSNQVNFGGFPFVPGESNNVFASGV